METQSFRGSPRRSPQVVDTVTSPVRSVHPEVSMAAFSDQVDFGHRSTDFFDDTTEDDSIDHAERHRADEGVGIAIDPHRPLRISKKRRSGHYLGGTTDNLHSQCEEKRISSPTTIEDYMRANPPEAYGAQPEFGMPSVESSFVGSIEEMTPSRPRRSQHHLNSHFSQHRPLRSPPSKDEEEDSPIIRKHSTKADQIMGVHALTLKALQRVEGDEQFNERTSRFLTTDAQAARHRSSSAPAKKVSMAPTPIDTNATRHMLPDHVVRTPYPFQQFHRKDFGRSPGTMSVTPSSPPAHDSIMTLSIRQSNPNSSIRISTMTIPANRDFGKAVKSGNQADAEKHFEGLDFDDMAFFRQLNQQYRKLLGPYRLFAARTLSQISVSGSASKAADAGYGWIHAPRSPRYVASRGLSDTFSEEKLLRHFQDPKLGKSRYAWVGWAHRLAAAPSSPGVPPLPNMDTPLSTGSATRAGFRNSMIRRSEQHEGIEFVVSWSAKRILLALVLVMTLSVAATMLWVFLGVNSHVQVAAVSSQGGGFRGAGDRAGAGVAIGICVLLLGMTGIGGWMGLSWLIL